MQQPKLNAICVGDLGRTLSKSDETVMTYDMEQTWERLLATFDSKRACFMKWISPAGVGGEWARQELQLNLAVALDHWRDRGCRRLFVVIKNILKIRNS